VAFTIVFLCFVTLVATLIPGTVAAVDQEKGTT